MILFFAVLAGLMLLAALALVGQDVAFYFLGRDALTTRFTRRRRRIRARATLVRVNGRGGR